MKAATTSDVQHRAHIVDRARAHAPFLNQLAEQRPELVDLFIAHGADAALLQCAALGPCHEPVSVADCMAMLRRRRADLALILALGDLSGEHRLERTMAELTDFADAACDWALAAAINERTPGEAVRGFAVIALGKMGSRELNYSSDIDPILIFDPLTFPRRQRDDPGEAAVRIARRWTEILSLRTGDGHVLRVDLRLRPSAEVTPAALPIDAAIAYYESHALAWEQAAYIRSRSAAGDRKMGRDFLSAIQPFIWRRSMDFGQIKRIADISLRIRDHYADGQLFGPGFDIKRGRGGIREIEFFAQVQQLIHGGRNPALRCPATIDALFALAEAGQIDMATAENLAGHYRTLRRVEHRLQMIDDQQTHSLPQSVDALDRVAALDGYDAGAKLLADLDPIVGDVRRAFDQLMGGVLPASPSKGSATGRWPRDESSSIERAIAAGFDDGASVARRIAVWRGGQQRVLRSAAAQDALEDVLPALIPALASASDPDGAINRFDTLVSGLPSAVNFFHLLAARPQLLAILVSILSYAPALADDLAARADLIEGLIDASVFAEPADPDALDQQMARRAQADLESHFDHVRRVVGDHRFALGVQLLESARDPIAVARGYCDIAEAALTSLTRAVIDDFARAHGHIAGAELGIIALGRFGGRALTHASDLDIILLHNARGEGESDGPKPLGAGTYFNRLGQRVIAALSVPTAAGRLYDVDTRLRPQGNAGPLVSSLDAFLRYQREDAWTWEHMALTRARCVFGSAAMRAEIEAGIGAVLYAPRDAKKMLADAVKMRSDIASHKPPTGPFDVKLAPGGLVDAEFAVHVQQLTRKIAFTPDLLSALDQLHRNGLCPADAMEAFAFLTRMLVTLRLMAPDNRIPDDPSVRARIVAICGDAGPDAQADQWPRFLARYDAALQSIAAWWNAIRVAP